MTRVLVVDDEPGLRQSLGLLLSDAGYEVVSESDSRRALERALAEPFDLILCDVRMPELDGPSLYRLLAQQQPQLCRRFIFLTGDTLEPATQAFLAQSGAPCLPKPFTSAEARRAIRRVLHLGHSPTPGRVPDRY